jgi:2-hydroxychromene-2-carboxylate isomerase
MDRAPDPCVKRDDRGDDNRMSSAPLQFWFEFASTYSYPAAMRAAALAGESAVTLTWEPFLLGPIFQSQGWSDSPFNLYPAKGRYMWRDLERICAHHRLPYQRPAIFPQNSLLAARVACAAKDETWIPDFVCAIYGANFAEAADISNPETVAACLRSVRQEPDEWMARAQSTEIKARLRAQTERAGARGIFGAPTFVSGDDLFWGHDRLEEAFAWHREHA